MKFILHLLFIFFPIIWIQIIGKNETVLENTILGLGGCISSLIFSLQKIVNHLRIQKQKLQDIKKRSMNEIVLISEQERIQLGSLMNHFIKQPQQVSNATNNQEGYCWYKPSKKMNRFFSDDSITMMFFLFFLP